MRCGSIEDCPGQNLKLKNESSILAISPFSGWHYRRFSISRKHFASSVPNGPSPEIYFSILQRKVLTPNDFASLSALKQRIIDFQQHYESIGKRFEWKFTHRDLDDLLLKMKKAA